MISFERVGVKLLAVDFDDQSKFRSKHQWPGTPSIGPSVHRENEVDAVMCADQGKLLPAPKAKSPEHLIASGLGIALRRWPTPPLEEYCTQRRVTLTRAPSGA